MRKLRNEPDCPPAFATEHADEWLEIERWRFWRSQKGTKRGTETSEYARQDDAVPAGTGSRRERDR